jgi:hypothetical protein
MSTDPVRILMAPYCISFRFVTLWFDTRVYLRQPRETNGGQDPLRSREPNTNGDRILQNKFFFFFFFFFG